MHARGARPSAVHTVAAKIKQASVRWNASQYWETLIRSERPEATINQPTTPSAAPSAKIVHNRVRSGGSIQPRQRNQRKGTRNTTPIRRAKKRCDQYHPWMV